MTVTHHSTGIIKSIRVPKSDVDSASMVAPPRFATSDSARHFSVMSAAILEKLCRSGSLSVYSKRTTPYILDTVRGKTALSVMVSTVSGDLTTKHMIVPITSLSTPNGVFNHVIVCAFVSKREKLRETNGGINVKLAGWATRDEVERYARETPSVATRVAVASVPVSDLHPIQTLRHYLTPKQQEAKEDKNTEGSAV